MQTNKFCEVTAHGFNVYDTMAFNPLHRIRLRAKRSDQKISTANNFMANGDHTKVRFKYSADIYTKNELYGINLICQKTRYIGNFCTMSQTLDHK